MASPSRFNKYGYADSKNTFSDPYIKTVYIPVTQKDPGVYNTGVFLPQNAQIINATDNVITPNNGIGRNISAGIASDPDLILAAHNTRFTGFRAIPATPFINIVGGEEIVIELVGNVFEPQYYSEMIITYLGSDA